MGGVSLGEGGGEGFGVALFFGVELVAKQDGGSIGDFAGDRGTGDEPCRDEAGGLDVRGCLAAAIVVAFAAAWEDVSSSFLSRGPVLGCKEVI